MHDDLERYLKSWGLKVVTVDGWRARGRPYAFTPRAIIWHHTASNRYSGNFGSSNIVTFGRSDLPGPLCQFLLGRDGTVKIIAGGRANHAGIGGPIAGIPRNMGNTYAWGVEMENDGVGERWPREQLNAAYRLGAALMKYSHITNVNKNIGHKNYAPGRKIDPAGINMRAFRRNVKKALKHGPSVKTIRLSRVKPGRRNADVLAVKRKLAKKGFDSSWDTKFFGDKMRQDYRRWQLHLGYEGHDANGIPGKSSLQKLGFHVI